MTTRLCIGLNKIALLRSSRGRNAPDITLVARGLIDDGCEALLVHPWSDRRHVNLDDVRALARIEAIALGRVALFVGGDLRDDLVEVVCATPSVDTFVVIPFDAEHLTTQRGWRASDDQARLTWAVRALGPRTKCSVFVDPEPEPIRLAADAGASCVELNCRRYVEGFGGHELPRILDEMTRAAEFARSLGLEVHAAHDLDARVLPLLVERIRPDQVSVGHGYVAEAIAIGMRAILPAYLVAIGKYPIGDERSISISSSGG